MKKTSVFTRGSKQRSKRGMMYRSSPPSPGDRKQGTEGDNGGQPKSSHYFPGREDPGADHLSDRTRLQTDYQYSPRRRHRKNGMGRPGADRRFRRDRAGGGRLEEKRGQGRSDREKHHRVNGLTFGLSERTFNQLRLTKWISQKSSFRDTAGISSFPRSGERDRKRSRRPK